MSLQGLVHWLWRAVDIEGQVLDILIQKRRNKKAAKRLFKKLVKKQKLTPGVIVTNKLKSYGVAIKEIELEADIDSIRD
ncbi:hypothetical protein Xen7305DRAFT_00054010 [Xenococcus sp. PCC 7305]|nr:hypothetical protein Xen7305DRAFT_00054010 [Xenococcus sp. PCC 7305]